MDVSNSTGQNTGYRVLGSGGAVPGPPKGRPGKAVVMKGGQTFKVLYAGELEPYTYITVKVPKGDSCVVEFLRDGSLIAEHVVPAEAKATDAKKVSRGVLIALMPNGNGTHEPCVCRQKA